MKLVYSNFVPLNEPYVYVHILCHPFQHYQTQFACIYINKTNIPPSHRLGNRLRNFHFPQNWKSNSTPSLPATPNTNPDQQAILNTIEAGTNLDLQTNMKFLTKMIPLSILVMHKTNENPSASLHSSPARSFAHSLDQLQVVGIF